MSKNALHFVLLVALAGCNHVVVPDDGAESERDLRTSSADLVGEPNDFSAGSADLGNPFDGPHADGSHRNLDAHVVGDGPKVGFTTIFTIVLENHDYNEIVGSSNAPYINSLINKYGLATNYLDSGKHPSLPNYLYMTSGQTLCPLGFCADIAPTTPFAFPKDVDNLGHQLEAAQIPWRAYLESMGTPCKLSDSGTYAARHNPFVYYTDIQSDSTLCNSVDVDYSEFAADLAAGTYRYMWISPNLNDDGHDPSASTSDQQLALMHTDTWLQTEVPKILASATYLAGGVIFITWDESEGRNGDSPDQVPMIVISPHLKSAPMRSATAHTHASYLATVEDSFGFPRLGDAATATSLSEFF